jgi:hypothetical protein
VFVAQLDSCQHGALELPNLKAGQTAGAAVGAAAAVVATVAVAAAAEEAANVP